MSLVGCHQTWIYSNLSKKGAINFSKIDAYITYWVLSIKQPVSENIIFRLGRSYNLCSSCFHNFQKNEISHYFTSREREIDRLFSAAKQKNQLVKMPNPSKCISTAEMFFLKTSISAEWHTSDLVWLRQKGSLLVLHPFFRYCIKFQSWTRACIQTHSPPHQIHELIVLKSYAPVVKLPAVKSSRFWYVK